MDIILNIFNNWTTYEKLTTLFLILIILIVIPGLVWIFTRHSNLALVSIFSLLTTGVLILTSLIILNQVFHVDITYTYKLLPFIAYFVNILCVGTMTGYYMQNHKHKSFDIKAIRAEGSKDALALSVSCVLLFSGFAALTPSILLPILLSLAVTIVVIWIHYLLLRKLIK